MDSLGVNYTKENMIGILLRSLKTPGRRISNLLSFMQPYN